MIIKPSFSLLNSDSNSSMSYEERCGVELIKMRSTSSLGDFSLIFVRHDSTSSICLISRIVTSLKHVFDVLNSIASTIPITNSMSLCWPTSFSIKGQQEPTCHPLSYHWLTSRNEFGIRSSRMFLHRKSSGMKSSRNKWPFACFRNRNPTRLEGKLRTCFHDSSTTWYSRECVEEAASRERIGRRQTILRMSSSLNWSK